MTGQLDLEGGCYCGALRYRARGNPLFKAQCHCRECQYISGGGPNYFIIMPRDGLAWTSGTPRIYARPDLAAPVTRTFCDTCGTHLTTELPDGARVVIKVGTLDNPAVFDGPRAAIHTLDRQPFHLIPEGVPAFERLP